MDLGWVPSPMPGVLIRERGRTFEEMCTQRHGAESCDDGDRDWSKAVISQGTPGATGESMAWSTPEFQTPGLQNCERTSNCSRKLI